MGFAFIMDSNGNSLDIHCCNKYSPSHSAKVSEKPIGNGNTTSDMRTLENLKISLDCIISNTPLCKCSDNKSVSVEYSSTNASPACKEMDLTDSESSDKPF